MPVPALILAAMLLSRPAIEMSVDAASGDVISGVHEFTVTVGETKGFISQVEFYVNHELRDSATGVPYRFKLDTIGEEEGPIDLEWRVYTTQSETAKKTISVKIDNDLSKGPEPHVAKAKSLLTDGKFDDAIVEARVALKAKKGFNPARVVLSRAYMAKGVFDRAQKFAEDAVGDEPDNAEALQLLAAIDIERANQTYTREGGDDAAGTIRDALKSAIELTAKVQQARLDAIPQGDDNALIFADEAIRSSRYTVALQTLNPANRAKPGQAAIVNRIGYCLVRLGRYREALTALAGLDRLGHLDGYSYTLVAVINQLLGDQDSARAMIKEAVQNDPTADYVLAAQAAIAYRAARYQVFDDLVNQLAQVAPKREETLLLQSTSGNINGRYDESKAAFLDAIRKDPTFADAYVIEGVVGLQLGALGKLEKSEADKQFAGAELMFRTALVARPQSAEALSGLALALLFQDKKDEAIRFAQAAVTTSPSYAAGYYVLAGAFKAATRYTEAQKAMDDGGKFDTRGMAGRQPPAPADALKYLVLGGRTPLILPPK